MYRCLTAVLALLFPLLGMFGAEPRKGLDRLWAVRAAKGVLSFIDTMTVRGVDPRYIEVPSRPWQVIVRGNINQSDLKLSATIDGSSMFGDVVGDVLWEPRIKTEPSTYAGLWAGYRGYGLGYSWNVGGDKGSILTLGAVGGSYGISLRIHRFENDEPELHYAAWVLENHGDAPETAYYLEDTEAERLMRPINTRTLILDGYYLFNGRRFSYAAAYDQSVIQRRSAGSFLAGAMYYHSHVNYAADENAEFILNTDDVGRFKQWKVSAGVGYAYNLVPCRGLLVSAVAVPMLTFYNRKKTWRYDSNLRDLATDTQMHSLRERPPEAYRLKKEPLSVSDSNSRMTLTIDARLSVTYNWDRYFVNACGQYNHFNYNDERVSGRLKDWYVNVSAGVRF